MQESKNGYTTTPNGPGGDTLYSPVYADGSPITDEIGELLEFYSEDECKEFLEMIETVSNN